MAIPFKDMAELTGTIVTSVFDGILKPPLFPNIKTGNDFQAHHPLARQVELLKTKIILTKMTVIDRNGLFLSVT